MKILKALTVALVLSLVTMVTTTLSASTKVPSVGVTVMAPIAVAVAPTAVALPGESSDLTCSNAFDWLLWDLGVLESLMGASSPNQEAIDLVTGWVVEEYAKIISCALMGS